MTFPDLNDGGWQKQPSGLEIWDVTEGQGEPVKPGGRVKVHYTGWLTTGKKFDSSVDRGEPIEFGLGQVIKGWQEAVPGMKPGGVRVLKVPSALAYGKKGRPGIPPDSDLVFRIELLEVK